MWQVGLDIGGTKMAAIALDGTGAEYRRWRLATEKSSYEAFLEGVARLVATIRHDLAAPFSLGIALPGSVSPQTGCIAQRQYPGPEWPTAGRGFNGLPGSAGGAGE